LVAAHIGGVIGDWLSVGARTINEGVEVVEHKLDRNQKDMLLLPQE